MKLLILNGPNMNLLGKRRQDVYGCRSYDDLVEYIKSYCNNLDTQITLDFFQTNHEGDIVDTLQKSDSKYDGVVINAAAYSHYSIAIRDAIEAISIPVIEVHMSDISQREKFRLKSMISDVCIGCIMGEGFDSYTKAINLVIKKLSKKD